MDKEEIIAKAKEYGLVEKNEATNSKLIIETTKKGDEIANIKKSPTVLNTSTPVAILEVTPTPTQIATPTLISTPVKEVEVVYEKININFGDTSNIVAQKLSDAKLINDKILFINELTKRGLSTELNVGEFKIKKGSNIDEIIKTIARIK